MQLRYSLIFVTALSLIVISWPLVLCSTSSQPLSLSLDKSKYQPGELMTITIKNVSDNQVTLEISGAYGLYCEKKVDDNWVFYPDVFNWSLLGGAIALSPGENVQVECYGAPLVPSDYRIAVRSFSIYENAWIRKSNYVELEVREPTNWPLIAGIVAVVVIIGVLAAFYVRRRS